MRRRREVHEWYAPRPAAWYPAGMRWLLALALCIPFTAPAKAASPQDVLASIRKAKAFIYGLQNKDGTWEPSSEMERGGGVEARQKTNQAHWGGLTALATYS